MADGLDKKTIRAGQRGVVTRRMGEARTLLREGSSDIEQVSRLQMMLEDKLAILKWLDSEILDLGAEEGDIGKEIEGADAHNQTIQDLLVDDIVTDCYRHLL